MYHFLSLKELFFETIAQVMNDRFMLKRHRFMLQLATFEADQSVG